MNTRYVHYTLIAPVADTFEAMEDKYFTLCDADVDFIPNHMSQSFFAEYSAPAFVVKRKEEG